jgi:multidrug efflux pump subunit AcrB
MNISETFIRRPIATSLLMAAIALFGIVAYRGLHISDLPTVANATINVNANLPGGDPGTMAASVDSSCRAPSRPRRRSGRRIWPMSRSLIST